MTLDLADDLTVAIDSSDYLIANKGDKITVKGLVMPSGPADWCRPTK